MQRVFIFADQVKKLISQGKRDIEIPEGARISAAAAELIKDHKLKIKIAAPPSETVKAATQTEDQPLPSRSTPSSSSSLPGARRASTCASGRPGPPPA